MTAVEALAAAAAEGLELRRSVNSTGFKNVTFDSRPYYSSKPYKAELRHGGRPKHLGYFMTPEEAALTLARFLNTEGEAAALAKAAPKRAAAAEPPAAAAPKRAKPAAKAAAAPPKKAGGPLPKGTKVTVDNGKKATVVSYNLVDGLYILQIEGESSASLLGYKKTKSWVIH
jgi:hypothetical protein